MKGFRTLWALPAVLVFAACENDAPTALLVGEVAEARGNAPAAPANNIVDVAVGNPNFTTLVAAVVRADLVGALSARGQLTVFAPTDAAFAELGLNAGNIHTVPVEALTNILLYHVANGRREAADVVSSTQIRMKNGDFTAITLNGGAFINDAQIVVTDVAATNGVIHVINKVLLP